MSRVKYIRDSCHVYGSSCHICEFVEGDEATDEFVNVEKVSYSYHVIE